MRTVYKVLNELTIRGNTKYPIAYFKLKVLFGALHGKVQVD